MTLNDSFKVVYDKTLNAVGSMFWGFFFNFSFFSFVKLSNSFIALHCFLDEYPLKSLCKEVHTKSLSITGNGLRTSPQI